LTDVILTEVEDNSGMLAAINDNFDKLETAINLTLSKANDAINTIHTTFDVNSQRLINLPAPVDGTDAARLVDITGTGSSASLPSVTGQAGKFLGTDGTSAIWTSFSTVTIPTSQITGDLTGNAANVNGTVVVGHGGTGATSLTGYVKGTGTSPLTASSTIPGSDITGNIAGNAAGLSTTLAIGSGGTGQTTAPNAINALVPSQTGNGGKYLSTNGSVVSWQSAPSGGGGGTVTDITAGAGLSGGLITISGTISITDTGVTAASYGAASKTLTATVNSKGQLTSLAETPIAITGAQVSGDIAGNAASLTSILPVLLGGTGSSTQGGARTALGATTVGSNVFTAVDAAAARTAIGAGTGNGNGTVTSITQGTGLTFSTTPLTSTGTISIDSTVVTLTGAQTLTNKTITQPNISTIANTGVLTLPTTTDTLVGRITTDTLQNKSMSGSQNTFTNLPISALTGGPLSVALGGTGAATLTGYLKGNGLTAVTASSTIPYTDISGTSSLVTLTGTQTLTNKTIAGSQITGNITGNAANVTGTVGYANGGTNATTQAAAQANMLPTQASNSGKFLKTNGSVASWATVSNQLVSVLDYGAVGDGTTDDTTAIQNAINATCASNSILFFPALVYRVSALTVGSGYTKRFHFIGEPGATLKANTSNNIILSIDGDISRTGSRKIENLKFDGNSLSNVKGIDFIAGSTASLYVYMQNIHVSNCDIGIEVGNIQEHHWQDIVCINNRVGIYAKSSSTDGGFTGSIFTGLHLQSNRVGMVMFSNSVYPTGPHQFNTTLIQTNAICGVAIIGDTAGRFESMNFINLYSEGNGYGTSSGDTETVDGLVIPRASFYAKNANAAITGGEVGSSYGTSFWLRNDSRLLVRDANIGGGSLIHVNADASSILLLEGTNQVTGSFVNLNNWDGLWYTGGGGGITSGVPVVEPTNVVTNKYAGTGLFPDAPEAENAVTATTSKVYDNQHGYVQRVSFGNTVGSGSTNRVTFTMLTDTTAVGDWVAVSVLMKANAATTVALYPTGTAALCGPQVANLTTEWQRFVIYQKVTSAATGGYSLYVYALDTSSPIVDFAKMMCVLTPAANSKVSLQSMIRKGYYNNNRVPFYAPTAPTTGTWPVGARVINSVPSSGQPKGWLCTTAGSPGTWTSEGNL